MILSSKRFCRSQMNDETSSGPIVANNATPIEPANLIDWSRPAGSNTEVKGYARFLPHTRPRLTHEKLGVGARAWRVLLDPAGPHFGRVEIAFFVCGESVHAVSRSGTPPPTGNLMPGPNCGSQVGLSPVGSTGRSPFCVTNTRSGLSGKM
jgi:hypothetical protein